MSERIKNNLEYEYDPEKDIMTIEGIRFSGDYFRWMASPIKSIYQITGAYFDKEGVLRLGESKFKKELFN